MELLPSFMILLLVSWAFNSLPFCASDNRLVPGKPLSPGNNLVSDDGVFALGFFSLSNSTTKRYYVGIWYNDVPQHRVVWVANRDSPITSPSATTLALTNGSNLVLSEAEGHVLWTTNISSSSSSSNLPVSSSGATLENTGNFILRSSGGIILWQSFDYPTDTLLPSMNLRLSHKTHPLGRLISWKDSEDPSPGNFSYSADPSNPLQRFVWNGTIPYRRSPVLASYLVVDPYMDSLNTTIYLTFRRVDNEMYMSFGIPSGSMGAMMKMDYSGKLKILNWDSKISDWNTLETYPAHNCSIYGYCGPSGYCDNAEPIPTCKCLDGFEPSNMEDWTKGRFSQGCRRKAALRCSPGDGFLALPDMKIPDNFLQVRNRSFDECAAECRTNCSCVAYAYANMSTVAINGDATRCLVWVGGLIDTEKFLRKGEILYIKINGSNGSKRKNKTITIVIPVVASLFILICIGIFWICNCRGKRRNKEIQKRLVLGDLSASDDIGDRTSEFPFISFRKIALATSNFSDSNMLGQGGFGKVYKGILEGGKEIAVKRLSKGSGQGVVEFRNEILLITKLQHKNLARLLGCSIQEDEKLLIYDYLPNKSLDACLFDAKRKSMLDWPTRFKIIKGVAKGLLYLHQDSVLMIVHRDLKASNILLDAEMNPKISDFGMARIFGGDQQQANTNKVVGTYGYMSPEYALGGVFSAKSDVYSFGVVLLEIVSGLKVFSTHVSMEFPNLNAYAWTLWMNENAEDLVDPLVLKSCSLDEVLQCIHVALLCVQDNPNARPLMSSVVLALEDGTTMLPSPEKPAYFAQRLYKTDGTEENFGSSVNNKFSVNNMSLTTIGGR